jgi:sister-chromatid-cohesion protein PDS5
MSHCCNSKSYFTSTLIFLYPLYVLQGAPCASYQLAVSIIQNCAEKLEPFICGFLTTCILDRDAVENELKEYYHEIIFQIFQCSPQMLLAVIPNLTHELLV